MRIAIAQTRPVKGNIEANIANHQQLVQLAISQGADAIFFPELSITGYEPTLAAGLATDISDSRLDVFQNLSDKNNITIAVGLPTKGTNGILITMIIFQPHQPRQAYSKQHLHSDELPFFINGDKQVFISNDSHTIAPGICYETSLPVHWENVHRQGANIYVASVAKTAAGVERSAKIFSEMSKRYGMTVLLSNSLGAADNFVSAGKSAAWNDQGQLIAQLDDEREGILIYNTATGWAIEYLRELGGHPGIELEDLSYAIQQGDVRWASKFLQRFPQLRNGRDKKGKPFRELAMESGHEEIINLFFGDSH